MIYQAGWYHVGAHERHWFRDGRSLCGEYSLMPGAEYHLDEAGEQTPDLPDGRQAGDCPECRSRRAGAAGGADK